MVVANISADRALRNQHADALAPPDQHSASVKICEVMAGRRIAGVGVSRPSRCTRIDPARTKDMRACRSWLVD
jgi:hypothetical protein